MKNQIYLLCLVFLLIVVQSISLDAFNRKASKARSNNDDDLVDDDLVISSNKYTPINDEPQQPPQPPQPPQPSSNRRNRYPSQGSPSNNHRSRSRWSPPSSYDDRPDFNDWSSYGFGPNNFPGSFPPAVFDTGAYLSNGPTCHSLMDPIYPLFADLCGSVPQARYSLPNAFGHMERWQIAQVLSVLLGPSTPSSSNPVCSRALRLLVCPLLFPPCPTRYEAPPVLPCQSFCRVVKNQCASPSLDLLPCDLLPPSSDLCPVNPNPYSSLLSSFGSPSPMAGPLSQLGLPQSPLSSLLAQSAFSGGFSPMDMPPSMLQSILAQSAFGGGPSPSDMFSSAFSPSPFAQGMTPQGGPSPFPFSSASNMQATQGAFPPGLASLFSQSGMPPTPFPLSPMNPFFNREAFMPDNLSPMLIDFPPLQYGQAFQQNPRFFPMMRSATEKV